MHMHVFKTLCFFLVNAMGEHGYATPFLVKVS